MKLATGGAPAMPRETPVEVGGVQLWTPRFEGLDRKAHAAVVDEFRNRNTGRPSFLVVSSSSTDEGVHVISAVSDSLKDRVKAPEIMKRLGLRGGGRPDFAQGGGVAPGDVEGFRAEGRRGDARDAGGRACVGLAPRRRSLTLRPARPSRAAPRSTPASTATA